MAYSILKHRRGTTQEWLDFDLVPEEGELVIEECQDGLRRCKVGDGLNKFSDLAYIDDYAKSQLIEQIASTKAVLNKKLNDLDTTNQEKLLIVQQALEQLVLDNSVVITNDFDVKIANSLFEAKTELFTAIEQLKKDINDVTSREIAELSSSIYETKEEITSELRQNIDSINNNIATVDIKATKAIEEQSVIFERNLTDAILKVEDTTEDKLSKIEQKILETEKTLGASLVNSLDNVKKDFQHELENVTYSSKKDIIDLNNEIEAFKLKVSEDIEEVDSNNEKALKASEESLISDYTTKISVTNDYLCKLIDTYADDSSELVAKTKTFLENLINSNKIKHENDIKKLEEDLIKADVAISEELSKLINQNIQAISELLSKMSTLDDKASALDKANASLVNTIFTIDNTLTSVTNNIRDDVANLKQSYDTNSTRINAEIASIDSAYKEADSNIMQALLNYVTKIYVELDDLVDDDITIIEKVFVVENSLREKIQQVNKELLENIDALSNTTNTKFSEVHQNIESVNTVVENNKVQNDTEHAELLKLISDNKSYSDRLDAELNSNIASTNHRLDNTNTALEIQSIRIDNLVAPKPGSLTRDEEVIDIRVGYNGITHDSAGEAVRAIGGDLNTLKDSLSTYIGTQAVSGLHYDYAGEVGVKQPYMLYLTAGNELIEDSAVQIISGAGGGGGGTTASSLTIGYITTSPIITTTEANTVLRFTFSGTDSSGDAILQASATWKINGVTVEYGNVKDGENEFDVTKYLSVGTTKVLLVVTDDNGSTVTKSWSIRQIKLSVDSAFNDKVTFAAGEEVVFTYIPEGSIEKTAIFKLDGIEIDRVVLGADVSGAEVKYRIPPQPHGAHLLELYLEAEINGIAIPPTRSVIKDILFYDASSDVPIIGTATPTLKIKQYSTDKIIYTVYDPKSETPTVVIKVDGVEVSTVSVRPNKDYGNTPTEVYSFTGSEAGTHTVQIICRNQVKTITVLVDELDINIPPLNIEPVFDFNPVGRNNNDIANRLWSHGNIHMTVSDNFDWTNGGYIPDDPNGPCFCIKAGSTATIDYKLFGDDAKKNGKEVKLVFRTKNVANPDAIFLSCIDNTTSKDHIGIEMGVHSAHIYGQNGNLELAYSEEDVIEFDFNISKNTEKVPMIMGYEDGVPSRPIVYDNDYNFTQNTKKDITLGSPDCDIFIYRFKVYNTSLTNTEILNNFIKDARTADEMIYRYTRNQIYDENHKLTPETLAEKCPWLRVYKVSAPYFTNNKSDKVKNTTIQQLYKNGDPVLDNWVCHNAQHSGQGTSSNNYGAAGRNLDFIMNKSDAYFELGDGTTTDKITLTRESVPVAYLNAKVNIASANNLTNAILAKRYNTFNPYRRPFVERDGINLDFIKDTMEFHNCVIFIQETDPNLSTHREFADTDWHFYAIGNIGDSKKTDDTRATDPNDKYECCVEIMDVGLPLSDFPVNTMINAMGYTTDEKTSEKNYIWAKPENLDILYELVDGEYVKTEDTEINLDKTYYVDILVNDDFSEDYTYGWRYISDEEDSEVLDFCKQRWIEFYRFVTTSSDEEFKARLSDYFVVDSALYYYLFTTRYCMVDNRAKNTFWHYSKTTDGSRKWDLCWDYDNDTSLGLNNYGKQVYRYGLEDIDKDAAGVEVFRESDSTFFCRIRDLFSEELKRMYNDLESKNAWHAESFLSECDAWQNEFPEELWRLDIERKYIRTYTSSFINGAGDHQFLDNMCNGRMKYHRRQWERNQEQYMASKYQTPTALDAATYAANFRVNRFDSTEGFTVLPDYQFTITPYSYVYLNVQYGGTAPISVRANPNEATTVPAPASLSADIINVGSAAAIRDFGDLSKLYPNTVSIQNAKRVKTLKLGNDTNGYNNTAFTALTTGANPLLEELNVENISSLTKTLNLTELINLKKLFAFGTNIPSVTFATDSKIQEVELPAVNSITLKQLKYLATDNLKLTSYDNVIDLVVEECPLINQAELFNKCTKLRRARLLDINFGKVSYEYFASRVLGLKGLTAGGEETPNAILSGSVRFESLTGSQFNDLTMRYPLLNITYDYLLSTITFKDTDLETTIHNGTSENAADYRNPVYYGEVSTPDDLPEGMIIKPVKASNAEFNYVFLGWSTTPNIVVSTENPDDNLTDEVRRAFREDTVKQVEGDRVLYPVFESVRRSYEVTFINPTAPKDEQVVFVEEVLYGYDATYDGKPIKQDAILPEIYRFTGWFPKPENITEPLICEAQFTMLDDKWYTIGINDISDCEDYNGNLFNGYSLNEVTKTMSITSCKNNLPENPAMEVPVSFTLDGTVYTVTSLGGFSDHTNLELIKIPDSVIEILSRGFYNCHKLFEINLSDNILHIGSNAFQGCVSIKELFIPASVESIGQAAFADCRNLKHILVSNDNARYMILNNCLVDKTTGLLLQGLSTGTIHESVKALGQYCFSSTDIDSIIIPDGITAVASNAFSSCMNLSNVSLPESIITLDATCFAWCSKLSDIKLPSKLREIKTYVFNSCPLTNVVIPASVENIMEKSFGDIAGLRTVTFEKRTDGSIPTIHYGAFSGSGSAESPIVFNLPWTEQQHKDNFEGTYTSGGMVYEKDPTFGAVNCIFNFDCKGEAVN